MTETGFGAGSGVSTLAVPPGRPYIGTVSSTALSISIAEDANPPHTEYAIYNDTDGAYVDASGLATPAAVWQARAVWGDPVTASGLAAGTEYMFKVKARNADGIETAWSPAGSLANYESAQSDCAMTLAVSKASSTISAPDFMSGLASDIRLAGKNLHELGFHVDSISGLDVPQAVSEEELIPGTHTWQVWSEYFALKRITIEGLLHGSTPDELRLRLAYLKSFFATFEGDPWRSALPVRLERSDFPDRHWLVFYSGITVVEPIGRRHVATSARVNVTMKCPLPFAVSNDTVRAAFTPAAGSFMPLDLGNAPSDAAYVITGPSVNPSFSLGNMVFHCSFSDSLAFSDVQNNMLAGTFSPPENESGSYRTTDIGSGLLVSGANTVQFGAPGNPRDGSWVFVVIPQWQSTEQSADVVVFEHYADTSNSIRLFWDAAGDRWVFSKRADGIVTDVASTAQAFTAGTPIVLGVSYDATNAGGMKLYINGLLAGIDGDTAALVNAPQTLYLQASDGSGRPDMVFDMAGGWSRMLSADEMLKIATDPMSVINRNKTVSYDGTLDYGDRLSFDSRRKTAELFDVSAGEKTNVLNAVTGSVPVLTPGRRRTVSDRTQTMLYTAMAAGGMEVRYARRYL